MRLGRRGSTALGCALIAPVVLLLTGAIVDFARYNWSAVALQHAVEKAARCAAVNVALCATSARPRSLTPTVYTLNSTHAPGVAESDFTLSEPACSRQVTATKAFAFLIGFNNFPVTLHATACLPS